MSNEMKKIGLCVCYDTKNYGSMLQTLATLIELDNLGYQYEIIQYTRKPTLGLIIRSLGRIPEMIKKRAIKKKKQNAFRKYPKIKKGMTERNQAFQKFIEKRFYCLSERYETYTQIHEAAKNYDAILVGSDQLWRPEGYSTGFYNLLFVPDEIPKIAYATSFGVSSIPENKARIATTFLKRIEYISVRELQASEIVKELTGRNVPTVVDPTLLFTGEEWMDIIPKKQIVGEKYIFCYLLGTNPLHRKWVKQLKDHTGYKIVTIPHLDEFVDVDIDFGDQQLFNIGPDEFINLIRHAEYICTDSFHGSVFSILNHKQFVTFNRFNDKDKNSRNSRISSLLQQTKLEERRVRNEEGGKLVDIIQSPIDYKTVDELLLDMRNRSISYLKNALSSSCN